MEEAGAASGGCSNKPETAENREGVAKLSMSAREATEKDGMDATLDGPPLGSDLM